MRSKEKMIGDERREGKKWRNKMREEERKMGKECTERERRRRKKKTRSKVEEGRCMEKVEEIIEGQGGWKKMEG